MEAETTEIMRFNASVIMNIPGIGYPNGGTILGEIGDIHRFSTPKNCLHLPFWILLYTNLVISTLDAHGCLNTTLGVLRYTLINAAHNVVKNNATFKAYYDKKMAEGRTHYNTLGHCADKLVRVILRC